METFPSSLRVPRLRSAPSLLLMPQRFSGSNPQDETTAVPSLVSSAHGTVLELGPGSGSQLPNFTTAVASGVITKIYGVEPTRSLHPALRQAIKKAKLDDVYEIVPCGIEDSELLARHGLTEGTVDCVVSIQVLCSVPRPQEVVKALHVLLQPGGELVVWEHVASTDIVSRLVQRMPCITVSSRLCGA